jgi:hypothetical protein
LEAEQPRLPNILVMKFHSDPFSQKLTTNATR